MYLRGQIIDAKAAVKYMLAGKAFVTLRSVNSGSRFTYKIELADKKKPTDPNIYFVNVLNGPDNWTNYKYIGVIQNGMYRWTQKAKIGQEAPSVKGFQFCFGQLIRGAIRGFEVWHEGKCGRCGRKLTVPESVADGFGPECITLVGGRMAPVIAPGTVAPRSLLKLALETSLNQPIARVAVNGTPASVPDIDAEIRRRITEYQANAPENYYQDGELDEQQAFSVAYNMFRVQIERERSL